MEELDVRATRLEIDLDILENNFRQIKSIVNKNTLISGVIKADAYGHGAVKMAEMLSRAGCDRFAVSTLEEGIELRVNKINEEILLLNNIPKEHLSYVIKYDLIPTIYSLSSAKVLNDLGKNSNKKIKIHIKVDTGMSRVGFLPNNKSVEDICEIDKLDNIEIEGIFTHFARADEEDKSFTKEQFSKFMWTVDELENKGVDIKIKHVSNSAAILDFPEYNLDMVRAGIILYGYYPSNYVSQDIINIKPAIKLKTKLSHVKLVDENIGIGYGHRFVTDEKTAIGTIPIGYADGYTRLFRNKAKAVIDNKVYDVVGNICMDQCMINLRDDVDYKVGTDVSLIDDDNDYISVRYLAEAIDTINYEILCMQGRRVPRVYYRGLEVDSIIDYLI